MNINEHRKIIAELHDRSTKTAIRHQEELNECFSRGKTAGRHKTMAEMLRLFADYLEIIS